MPARTKNSYTVPGVGTTVRGKSGAAKKFVGSGRSPSGTVKAPERAYDEVPTVTTTSSGTTTSNFPSEQAARRAKRAQKATKRRVRRIVHEVRSDAQMRREIPKAPRAYEAPKAKPASYDPNPLKAVISSAPNPQSKPETFKGLKTAGTPTLKELRKADKAGTLKANAKGFTTTPAVRAASKKLKQAKKAVRKSGPSLAGLSPQEKRAAKLDVKIGPKYGIPPSVLMAQQRQESGFDPAAVSSADAQGISQFIPSTAASYGVQFGTGQPEVRSQIRGQAKLLRDSGFATDPKGAMSAYTGGYSDAEYNDPVLEGAADYKALDKKGNPRALKELASAKKEAQKLGLKVAGKAVGPAPRKVVTRFEAAKQAMKEVEGLPYVWGGGHGSPTSSPTGGGLDCSGAVGYVLNKIHAMKGSLTSGDMGSVLKPGPGALTVFYNGEHTFLRLGNEYWGTSVGDSGAGGLGPHPAPSAGYLAEYNVGHVPGLGRKQALQLGFKNLGSGGAQTFPGMTLSSDGSTATINEGAGTTKAGAPGFSKKPITLQQKVARTNRKLKSLGVGVDSTAASHPEGTSVLDSLERKYKVAA